MRGLERGTWAKRDRKEVAKRVYFEKHARSFLWILTKEEAKGTKHGEAFRNWPGILSQQRFVLGRLKPFALLYYCCVGALRSVLKGLVRRTMADSSMYVVVKPLSQTTLLDGKRTSFSWSA